MACRIFRAGRRLAPSAILAIVIMLSGCPPTPMSIRTRTVDLPEPVEIQPVIVEHMQDHVSYRRDFDYYLHRFETTYYTFKLTDGREMDVYIGSDNPYVVMRNLAGGQNSYLGIWTKWSDPVTTPMRPPPYYRRATSRPTTATTQGVTP